VIRAQRLRGRRYELGAVAVALAAGTVLSLATTRVVDWFVMTDELLYERLAISIAQTGSPLPQIHGDLISNINQLYPLLLSPVFGGANVPASLHDAHALNAFVMASAAIPIFLLARTVLGRPLVSLGVAALGVSVPWMVLSSFLLTEVAAYPAFCWALLAVTQAVIRKRSSYDVVALVGVALAVSARVQFLVLAVVLPLAILVEAAFVEAGRGTPGRGVPRAVTREIVATRRPLLAVYAFGLVVVVALAALGSVSSLLGTYATTVRTAGGIGPGLFQLAAEHLAVLSLTFAILPVLVGIGWAIGRLRPAVAVPERGFAIVSLLAIGALTLQVASFDERFGNGLVKDRYLFYVAPLLIIALAGAIVSRGWPLRTLAIPAAICAIGFATFPISVYEKLNVDSPSAIVNDKLLELATSERWAHVMLAVSVPVLAVLFVQAALLLPRTLVAGLLAAVTLVLPAQAIYAFDRLFAVNGTSGRPITLDQGIVFNWIDRTLGPGKSVTIVPYPTIPGVTPGDYWAGASFWWSAEFWNEDVKDSATVAGTFSGTPSGSFPKLDLRFDPKTGAANETGNEYVARLGNDARFNLLLDTYVTSNDGVELVEPARPWRATWVSYGLYDDGWTRPRVPARIRVFSAPGQTGALVRYITVGVQAPSEAVDRPFSAVTNLTRWDATVPPGGTSKQLPVCVPAGGHADVRVSTPNASPIYGDLATATTASQSRDAGLLLQIALADENTPVDRCP